MRKLTFLLLFVLAAVASFAQISLTYNTHGVVTGDNFSVSLINTTNVNPGPAGPSKTWSFTFPKPSSPSQLQYINPSSTPYASKFTSSTTCNYDATYQVGAFYKVNTSGFTCTGITTAQYALPYSDDELYYRYPFTINSTSSDNFSGSYSNTLMDVKITRAGHVRVDGDAFGTLKLFGYTFNNALRLNVEELVRDDAITISSSDTIQSSVAKTITYQWYINSSKYPLLQIATFIKVSLVLGDTFSIDTTQAVQINSSVITDVPEEMVLKGAEIYPNPVRNDFYVSVKEPGMESMELALYDIRGRMLKNEILQPSGGSLVQRIDLSELPAGVYTVKISGTGGTFMKKIMKY